MKRVFGWLKIPVLLLVLIAVIGLAVVLMPWQKALEGQLETMLAARGFGDASLEIAGIGRDGLVLENISFGNDTVLTLRNVALDYSLAELRERRIGGLKISGLDLDIRKTNDQWVVSGMEDVFSGGAAKDAPLSLPVSMAGLGFIPFSRLAIDDSRAAITSTAWQVRLPLEIEAEKTPIPKLTYHAKAPVHLKFGAIEATAEQAQAEIALIEDEKIWRGPWSMGNIRVTGVMEEIPLLNGTGTITVDEAARITIEGKLISADQRYRLDFRYAHDLNQPDQAALTIIHAELPWKGGTLAVRNTLIPLAGKGDLRFDVQVKNVSIDALLQAITGKRVTATGQVSGTVPVVIARDGSFTLRKGVLKAQGPGVIQMAPESIPGNHEQIELVRSILSDLQYSRISIETESGTKDNFAVLLALEGHNPAVYNGRAVNLNVRFTGDVLDFIQQNLMLLNNPEKLLKAGNQ